MNSAPMNCPMNADASTHLSTSPFSAKSSFSTAAIVEARKFSYASKNNPRPMTPVASRCLRVIGSRSRRAATDVPVAGATDALGSDASVIAAA